MRNIIKLFALMGLLYEQPAEAGSIYTILSTNNLDFTVNGSGNCTFTNINLSPSTYASILLATDSPISGSCTPGKPITVFGSSPVSCSFETSTPTSASLFPYGPFIVACQADSITTRTPIDSTP